MMIPMKIQFSRSGSYMGGPVTRITDLGGDVKRVKLWSLLWSVSPRTRYARRCQDAILDLCISLWHLAQGGLGGQLGSRLLDAWGLYWRQVVQSCTGGQLGWAVGRVPHHSSWMPSSLKNVLPCNLVFGCIVVW